MINDLELREEFTSTNLVEAFKNRLMDVADVPLTYGQQTITLQALDNWSSHLALHLTQSGVKHGEFIAIYQPCNFALAAGAVAFAKLGLNVIYFRDTVRTEIILEQAIEGAFKCIVTSANNLQHLPQNIKVIRK